MFWIVASLIVGAALLYLGSEWLVRGGKGLALNFGISPFIIGLTILAFGSSAPEAITSIVSVDNPSIIIGNVVGSNIANIGLAIGIAAIAGPMVAKYSTMRQELWTMLLAAIGLCILAILGDITWIAGIVLIALLGVFIYYVFRVKGSDEEGMEVYTEEVTADTLSTPVLTLLVIVGLVALYFGARFFVDGAVDLAKALRVPQLIIGLVVVAIGTSLPELCISVLAAYRGEADMAVANIVGSNIFNIFFVLGIGAVLTDVPVSESMLMFHLPVMVILSVVMFLLVRFRNKMDRKSGVLLLAIYAAYIAIIFANPDLMM